MAKICSDGLCRRQIELKNGFMILEEIKSAADTKVGFMTQCIQVTKTQNATNTFSSLLYKRTC